MTTLRYTKITTESISEEVEGIRVTARCISDDGKVDFSFDCTEALDISSRQQITDLVLYGARDCGEADNLAEYYGETRTSKLYTYLDLYNNGCGYSVIVDRKSLVKWLKQKRPEWCKTMLEDEDITKYLKDLLNE
jgi:hypothetical protein